MFDLDEEEIQEMEQQIKLSVKVMVRTLELLWEELQKANLPDELKKQILLQYKENK